MYLLFLRVRLPEGVAPACKNTAWNLATLVGLFLPDLAGALLTNTTNNTSLCPVFFPHVSGPDPGRAAASRRANTAKRRATHNAVECQRRETLNGRFLIRRPSKSSIVNSSIAHIHASRRQPPPRTGSSMRGMPARSCQSLNSREHP
ncbi:hypothetical protein H2248_004216 [Termitomyces sp. 'cryptogamus']|nr:hypothetical protein H2248_004216 [Termitomyces sp. 'cryptogamus']